MLRPNRLKKKPPIEISNKDSTSTFSPPSPSPSLFRIGEKRGHPQSSPKKENQKPVKKKTIKPTTTTDSTDNIPSYPFSPEQHLSFALESLTQAYIGLEEEEEEREEIKEQVEQLVYYTRSILLGENPFTQEEEKEKANNVLKGLVEEVRALRKEVAPTKETYAERLKKDLPSSSSLPSSLSPPLPSTPSPSSRSSTSTRSKKKQL